MLKYIPYRISLNKVIISLNQATTGVYYHKQYTNRQKDLPSNSIFLFSVIMVSTNTIKDTMYFKYFILNLQKYHISASII